MKKKYVVPVLIVLFIGWLIFSMTGTQQQGAAKLEAYAAKVKEITDQSLQLKIKQQNLLDQIKDDEITEDEARKLAEEYKDKQQELVNKLVALETPEEIPGPASFLRTSLEERVTAADKTLKYLETKDTKWYNEVKEHLIRSQGGIMSAFQRIKDTINSN